MNASFHQKINERTFFGAWASWKLGDRDDMKIHRKSDLSLLILLAILEILMNRFYKNKYAYTT